jgi:hypothetical protein
MFCLQCVLGLRSQACQCEATQQATRDKANMAELSEDRGLEVQPVHTAVYTAETDSLSLEDESMRVNLDGGWSLKLETL